MQLSQFITEAPAQKVRLVLPHRDGPVYYNMILAYVGDDGNGNPVYFGHNQITQDKDDHNTDCFSAVVFKGDKVLAMISVETPEDAKKVAEYVVTRKQKGYGPNMRDHLKDWHTSFNDAEVIGYKP